MSSASTARIRANRANAQKSTGPRTEEGKRESRMSAVRHGLTGRIVVLPTEDMQAYRAFVEEIFHSLAPETAVERQFAQTIADTQWRLNRVRTIEEGMLGLGLFEAPGQIDVDHPAAHSALTSAGAFRQDSQAFANLSLYEQRLHRTLKEAFRQLDEHQAKRIAARDAELQAAVLMRNLHKMTGERHDPDEDRPAHGFVFSNDEVEAEARRQLRLADARYAAEQGYDLDLYRQKPLKMTA